MADQFATNPAIINFIYPVTAGSEPFNLDYYLSTHMPLVQKTLSSKGLKSWKVTRFEHSTGYQIQAILEFETVEKMTAAFGDQAVLGELMGDVKNFTSEKPLSLFGAVIASN